MPDGLTVPVGRVARPAADGPTAYHRPVPATPSTMTEDYLKVIWKAEEWPGDDGVVGGITTNEIAAQLGVGASTVSGNLRKLARDGWLHHEPYRPVALTDAGRDLALRMVRRHRLIETYLVERLGYGWDEVHDEAEVLEHAVSDRLLARFDDELGHPTADPHGDPIPAADGTVVRPEARRLGDVPEGGCGPVVRVSDDDPELLRYLGELGLRVGAHVRVGTRRAYADSVQVEVLPAAGSAGDAGTGGAAVGGAAVGGTTAGADAAPARTVDLAGRAAASVWTGTSAHEHTT